MVYLSHEQKLMKGGKMFKEKEIIELLNQILAQSGQVKNSDEVNVISSENTGQIFGAINVRFDAINIYINTKDKNFFD